MRYHPWRWLAVSVFVLSSTLNYLDRALIGVLAPLIMRDFAMSNQQLGWLIAAFSVAYAVASLPAGWLLDRIGINRGISIAAAFWSAASVSTGLVNGLGSLSICRAALGLGEAAGVPAFGKVNGEYLRPEERALGAAVNGVGISVGLALAPLWITTATAYGWRRPFVISGLLGFAWIPLWWITSRWIQRVSPGTPRMHEQRVPVSFRLLADRRLILLVLANVLWMSGYSLWSYWITLYLTNVYHVSLESVKHLASIPALVSNVGGFFGGWLSLYWIKRGAPVVLARKRAIWLSAAGCLGTLALLGMESPAGATIVIAISFFFVLAGSVNLYALPIDLYGASRAAFAISALTCGYGVLQTVISPLIGWLGDHHLYRQSVWLVAIPPLISSLLLLRVKADGERS